MTILGQHTAHELSDLIAAKTANIGDLATAVGNAPGTAWLDSRWSAWQNDYNSFIADWNKAKLAAQTTVADAQSSLAGWDYTTAENDWTAVLAVLGGDYGTRLPDLMTRWTKLPNAPALASSPVPQPTAPDSDLGAFNATGAVTVPLDKAGTAIASAVSNPATPYVVGAVVVLGFTLLIKLK
jgi:hypothetical protein